MTLKRPFDMTESDSATMNGPKTDTRTNRVGVLFCSYSASSLGPEPYSLYLLAIKRLAGVKDEFEKKEFRFQSTWQERLGAQMSSIPEFEEVFRTVKQNLRQAGICTGSLVP